MPTFSKHIPDAEVKEWMDSIVDKVVDERHLSGRGEALKFIFDVYVKGIETLKQTPGFSKSAQELIDEVGCPHLRFEDLDFKCFERMHKQKKPDILGSDPSKVQTRCDTCKQGKAEVILQQYQNKLRGQNIKGILSMIKQFQEFAKSGVPSTIYFCNRIPTRQVITGKKTIHCGKVQMQIVPIDPTCKDPKCRFFQEFTIKVEHEFPQDTLKLIEGIAQDYKLIENLSPEEKKEVDADQE
jgi:hypothetical protein